MVGIKKTLPPWCKLIICTALLLVVSVQNPSTAKAARGTVCNHSDVNIKVTVTREDVNRYDTVTIPVGLCSYDVASNMDVEGIWGVDSNGRYILFRVGGTAVEMAYVDSASGRVRFVMGDGEAGSHWFVSLSQFNDSHVDAWWAENPMHFPPNPSELNYGFTWYRGADQWVNPPQGDFSFAQIHTISGRVTRPDGQGVAGATVEAAIQVVSDPTPYPVSNSVTTNANGNYIIPRMPSGAYRVRATDSYGTSTEVTGNLPTYGSATANLVLSCAACTPTPGPPATNTPVATGSVTVISVWPQGATMNPGQSFNPEVIVQTSGFSLNCGQDFLENRDGNLYNTHPIQGCVSQGNNRYRIYFNMPMQAPGGSGQYHSKWKVWHYPNHFDPEIDIWFQVGSSGGGVSVISAWPTGASVNPGQSFNPEVIVQTSGFSLNCGQDFLENRDGSLYSTHPIQGCVDQGNNRYRIYFNMPMRAPDNPGEYHSRWQIWHYPNHVGPEIDLWFRVGQPNHSPTIPTLLSPGDWSEIRSESAPTLCWNASTDQDGDPIRYWVRIRGAVIADSDWITDTCWRPTNMDRQYFGYGWDVKAQDNRGGESGWSTQWHYTLSPPAYSPPHPTSTPPPVPTLPVVTGPWWMTSFVYRMPITVTTDRILPAGTMMKLDQFDLSTLVAQGKVLSNFNDLRVVRKISDTSWQEVARAVWSHYDLEFVLPAAIDQPVDTSYYLYFGNPNAGAPPTFSLTQGLKVDLHLSKWWDSYHSTVNLNGPIDYSDTCNPPVDHRARTGSAFDDSEVYWGRIFIPYTGLWTFREYTADGYELSIDGGQIGRFDGYDTNRWVTVGSANLRAGWHEFEIHDMWVNCNAMKLSMQGPNFSDQIVPASYYQRWWGNLKRGLNAGAEERYTTDPPTSTPTIGSPTATYTPTPLPPTPTSMPAFSDYGDGRDGPMPSSGNLMDYANGLAYGTINGTAGSNAIAVVDRASIGRINPGDYVLLHQTRGDGAIVWEKNRAVSDFTDSGNYVLERPLQHTYTTQGYQYLAQIIRIPQYSQCSVSGAVTGPAWSGVFGGIIPVMCSSYMNVSGSFTADYLGFHGGDSGNGYATDQWQGESVLSPGSQPQHWYQTPNTAASGQGGGAADQVGGGGGGAGCSNGNDGDHVGGSTWGQGGRGRCSSDGQTMSLGGGGGGGATSINPGTGYSQAGRGGGLVYIWASELTISGSGSVTANGQQALGVMYDDGTNRRVTAGSGGAGQIYIRTNAATVGTNAITALGAPQLVPPAGGTGRFGGGRGGDGIIHVLSCAFEGSTLPSANLLTGSCPTTTPTQTQTQMPTTTQTSSATSTSTWTVTSTPSHTNTLTPTNTPTETATKTQTATNTSTAIATSTETPISIGTATPGSTSTSTPTRLATSTPTSTTAPTYTITSTPTSTATGTPLTTATSTSTNTSTHTSTATSAPLSPTSTSTPSQSVTPVTGAAFAHIEPSGQVATGEITVSVGSSVTLDLIVNAGIHDVTVQDSYLSFPPDRLQNVRVGSVGCVLTSTVTSDLSAFDSVNQNQVCNGPGNCFGGTTPPGSVAFASGIAPGSPSAQGEFRVARMALCANTLGDAVLRWQFSPPDPANRNSKILDENNQAVHSRTLYKDFVIHVVPQVLVGHAVWQGRPAQPHQLQQMPITVTLTLSGTQTSYSYPNIMTDANGFFTMTVGTLPTGTYTWWAKGVQHLASGGSLALAGAPTTQLEVGMMRSGDANNDNVVDGFDYNVLRASYGKIPGQPGYDGRVDFTGDEVIDGFDYNILRTNYGAPAPEPAGPDGPQGEKPATPGATPSPQAVIKGKPATLELRPVGNTPGNGGKDKVSVGQLLEFELWVNGGEQTNLAGQDSYLEFPHSQLQNVQFDTPIGQSCVLTNTLTPDLGVFNALLQNEACNGPGPCLFRGNRVQAPAGTISYASAVSPDSPSLASGSFRVAKLAMCAVSPGEARIRWQYRPQDPPNRNSKIYGAVPGSRAGGPNATGLLSDPSLFVDYLVTIVKAEK
jgi:hypothetical protein